MSMAKKSNIDAVDDNLNYLANSMSDWAQTENALSEAAAMLSGIAKSRSGEEDEVQSLKRGLDDITASINRMNALAREDMADVIEQTQRDNELLEAINLEPINLDPIIEEPIQPKEDINLEPVNTSDVQSQSDSAANQVKISKLKPLDDSTSGMAVDKIAELYKISSGKESKQEKQPKAKKASKHSKAPKASKHTPPASDGFETVVSPESETAEDGFRFVDERKIVENPVEWKMDEAVLRQFSASQETQEQAVDTQPAVDTDQVSVEETVESVSFASGMNTVQNEPSFSASGIEPGSQTMDGSETESFLSGADTGQEKESLSTISAESDVPTLNQSMLTEEDTASPQTPDALLSESAASQHQPEAMVESVPDPMPEPAAAATPASDLSGANMSISNDMFDLGIDLSDEPDYSDENIDLNAFSGSIADAEQYNNQPENSVDLDAEHADSGLSSNMDLSNLVAAAMNDLAGRNSEPAAPEPPQMIQDEQAPTVEEASPAMEDDSPADEEDYSDVPTISNLENEFKKAESEKRRSEGEEARQQGSTGFAYALNEVEQVAATNETEPGKRVVAQYLVQRRGEDERAYYRLIFR